jgi:hypothetical protein
LTDQVDGQLDIFEVLALIKQERERNNALKLTSKAADDTSGKEVNAPMEHRKESSCDSFDP